jgi:protein required for attachment to host cells
MPERQKTTWVLTADDSKARVLESHGRLSGLSEVADGTFNAERKAGRDIFSDRPGRSHESATPTRHAMEYRTSAEEQERWRFVQDLSQWLQKAQEANRFERLVLIAAPKTLGALRKQLPQSVQGLVDGELAKDLTGMPAAAIAETLANENLL